MTRCTCLFAAAVTILTAPMMAATTLFEETFEGGTPGQVILGTNGWTGADASHGYLKYSATTIDAGQSAAGSYDWTLSSWPRISKTFTNTTAAGEYLEWTATMWVANTWGDYMHLELRQTGTSGDQGVMKVYTGYGTLDFFLYGMDGSNLFAFRPSQVTSPVDVKVVMQENPYRTDCFYRLHGAADWTYVGGADAGMPLAGYTQVDIVGHNHGSGTETGSIDSIRLIAEAAVGKATDPSPTDGAVGVGITAQLTWAPGGGAMSHDVYFGTTNPPPFVGNQTGTTYNPGTLAYATTYYWRIDERNAGSVATGDVWSFTTQGEPIADGTVLWEDFEGGAPGTTVAGTNGWVGTPFFKYSSWTIDQGQSAAGTYDPTQPAWVRMHKLLPNPIGARRAELSATMEALSLSGDYAHVELRQAGAPVGERGLVQLTMGYGSMDCRMWAMDGTPLLEKRLFTQPDVPVDLKVVLEEFPSRTDFYWRIHGEPEWTWIGGDDVGLPLAGYERVEVAGHNYDTGAETGNIDSILLKAVALPGKAYAPSPANGAANVALSAQLSWTPWATATSHNVYFGTTNPPPFVGNQTGTSYNPGLLAYSTTYYWRIDEITDAGTTTGDVWSFTTQGPAVMDGVVFEETFEGGTAGTPLAGSNGWTGHTFMRYSATTIDNGQSGASVFDPASPAWPRITKTFPSPIGSHKAEFTATMQVLSLGGDYMHLELRQPGTAGEKGVVQLFMGYGTMDFRVFGFDGATLVSWRVNSQPDVPVDLKIVLQDNPYRTDCYWRVHGAPEWTWVGGDDAGLPLIGFDRVEVVGHNYGDGAETANIDSIRLTAIATCATPAADADADGDVDLGDFGMFQSCFNGPNRPYATADPACTCLDSDDDGDTDLTDFGVFQTCFNGPNRPAACP